MKNLLKLRNLVISFLTLSIVTIGMTTSANAAKEVVWLTLSDLSGPVAGIMVPVDYGMEMYFRHINDQGGVDGVKIKYITVDVRYNVARAMSAYSRYRGTKNLFGVFYAGTAIAKALGPMVERDKVIGFGTGDGKAQGTQAPYTLNTICAYADLFGGTIDYIIDDWKKKGNTGFPKVGYISWDASYGKEPLLGGKEYAETQNVKMLPPELFPIGALDYFVYLNRLGNAGADYIIVGCTDPTSSNIIVQANRMGLTKKIVFIGPFNWELTENQGLRSHPKELEGCIVAGSQIRGEDMYKHPFVKLWNKYSGKQLSDLAGGFFSGMCGAISFVEALRISLKEVGYENLNTDVMMRNYKKLGQPEFRDHRQGIAGPCSYGPNNIRGSMSMKFYQVRGGKLFPITGWRQLPDAVSMHDWKK